MGIIFCNSVKVQKCWITLPIDYNFIFTVYLANKTIFTTLAQMKHIKKFLKIFCNYFFSYTSIISLYLFKLFELRLMLLLMSWISTVPKAGDIEACLISSHCTPRISYRTYRAEYSVYFLGKNFRYYVNSKLLFNWLDFKLVRRSYNTKLFV